MTLKQPEQRPEDAERHRTDYDAERGGWYPPAEEDK